MVAIRVPQQTLSLMKMERDSVGLLEDKCESLVSDD